MSLTWDILDEANDQFAPQDTNGYWVYGIGTLDDDQGEDTTLSDLTIHDSVGVKNVDSYGSISHAGGAAKRNVSHEFSVTNLTATDITLDVLALWYDDGNDQELIAYHTITDITVPAEESVQGGTKRYTTTVDTTVVISAEEVTV